MCLYLYRFQNPNMGRFGRIICTTILLISFVLNSHCIIEYRTICTLNAKFMYMPMALGLMTLIFGAQTREWLHSPPTSIVREKKMSLKGWNQSLVFPLSRVKTSGRAKGGIWTQILFIGETERWHWHWVTKLYFVN